MVEERAPLTRHVERARAERGVTFVGRLDPCRHLDMDATIREALDCGRRFRAARAAGEAMPAFVANPLRGWSGRRPP